MRTITTQENLLEAAIAREELTTKKLNELGFKKSEIKQLVDEQTIVRTKKGFYKFNDANLLFSYFKKLKRKKLLDKAYACIHLCQELDSKNEMANFYCFYLDVMKKDYTKAFSYLRRIVPNKNPNYHRDNLTYLYLLNQLIDLPKEYKELLERQDSKSILVLPEDSRYPNQDHENSIRQKIFNRRFWEAAKQLGNSKRRKTFRDKVLGTMTCEINCYQKENDYKLIEFINNKDYHKAIEFLENLILSQRSSKNQEYALKLLYALIDIQELQVVPEATEKVDSGFYRAIDANDFAGALKMTLSNKSGLNYLAVLLREINSLTEKINKLCDVPCAEICKPSIDDVIKHLLRQEYQSAYTVLKYYMYSIGNSDDKKYFFLVKNLLKLSLLEKDLTFAKPLKVISEIKNFTFVFVLEDYVRDFYYSISCGDVNRAKIFLDIIKESREIDDSICYIEALEGSLRTLEQSGSRRRVFYNGV